MGLDLERLVEMQQGPVQLPHARTHVSQPPRRVNTRRDSTPERPIGGWEAGAGGMSEPMSQLLGVESRTDRGQELNSSPALPLVSSHPLKRSDALHTHKRVPGFIFSQHAATRQAVCAERK